MKKTKAKVKCKGLGIAIISGLLITITIILISFSRGLVNQNRSKWESEDGKFIIYTDLSYGFSNRGYSTIKINDDTINGYSEIRKDGSVIISVEYNFSERSNEKILERWVVKKYNLFSFTAEVEYSNTYDVGEEIKFKRIGSCLSNYFIIQTDDCTGMEFNK